MKKILITGASRGIGFELVKQCAKAGDEVFAVSRNASKLEALKTQCETFQGKVHVHAVDLMNEDAGTQMLGWLKDQNVDVLDILINNAGKLLNKPFEEITPQEQLEVYQVNVFGVMNTIRALLPLLKQAELAHVINIGSMGGFQGSAKFSGLNVYSSSKAALAGITECLAEEYQQDQIRFNCLALGAVQTEMLAEAFPGYEAPVSAKGMAEFILSFAKTGHKTMNGKVIPLSLSTP